MHYDFLILGGGFGGLSLANSLSKKYPKKKLGLVSPAESFVFTPVLYEAASAESELVNPINLQKVLTFSIPKLCKKWRVDFIKSSAQTVNPANRTVQTKQGVYEYQNLIISTGSQNMFFNIPGAADYSLPLKTNKDALKIQNALAFAVQSAGQETRRRLLRIVVAGGGHSGVEIAAELTRSLDFLSWKFTYPRELIEVVIIDSNSRLVSKSSKQVSADCLARLKSLGVRCLFNQVITRVDSSALEFQNFERLAFDLLIWTAGTAPNPEPLGLESARSPSGYLLVNEFLQVQGFSHIFALGDTAKISHPKYAGQNTQTASQTILQAKYLCHAFRYLLVNTKPREFPIKSTSYILSLGGKWAILESYPWYIKGFLAYLIKLVVHCQFFISLLGVGEGLKVSYYQIKYFGRND